MSLKKQTFSGVKWTTASSLVNALIQLIQLSILTRLLSSEDFGLMAIVMVVIGFSQLFIDMGVSNAIIYKQKITKKELSSLYWLNILIGCLFFLIIFISSPLIADFYHNKRLISLINLVAVTFLIKPWGQQLMVMLHKKMQFKATSKIEIAARLIAFTIVIILAYNEYGVYSLAIGTIIYAFCTTLGYNFFGRKIYRPQFHFNRKEIREYINFGLFQMGDKSLNYFASQLDTVLIGKLLGVEILGVYNVAKDLTSKPYAMINPIITKVTFPLMSKIIDNTERLKIIFLNTIQYLSYLNIALYLLIAILAKPIILLMFGVKWLAAIPIVQILAITFIFRSFGNPAGSLLLSRGKASIAFFWNLGIFLFYPFYLYIGSFWKLEGVAIASLLLQISLFLPNWRINVYKFTNISLKEYILAFKNPFILTFLAIIITYPISLVIENNILTVLISTCFFGMIFLTLLIMFERKLIFGLIDFIPEKLTNKLERTKLWKLIQKVN